MKTNKRNRPIEDVVDDLGQLKAQIADLCTQEKDLKQLIIDNDEPVVNGSLFRATLSYQTRTTLDLDKLRMLLSKEQIEWCEKQSDFISVRVSAKTR